jgi:cytochrome b
LSDVAANPSPSPAPACAPAEVQVWDLPLRLFHWSLAAAVLVAYFSANIFDAVHEAAGYIVLALIGFRLVWGFAGSRYSRFRIISKLTRSVVRYLAQVARGQPGRYLGLNPAGATMAVALLALLLLSCISGWMQLTQRFFGVDWIEELHAWSSHLILALVIVHVSGVVLMCRLQGENLVRAMFTGRKRNRNG